MPQEKPKESHELTYPYETDEFKIYTVGERNYSIYKNGRIFSEAYSVLHTDGRLRHFDRREVEPTQNKHGYWYCNLGGRLYHERWLLHRLIATVWYGKHDNLDVNHIDCNKGNNSVENLEFVTRSENEIHKNANGRNGKTLNTNYNGYKNNLKYHPLFVENIKRLHDSGMIYSKIAERYNMPISTAINMVYNSPYKSKDNELFAECSYWETTILYLNNLNSKYALNKDDQLYNKIAATIPNNYYVNLNICLNYEIINRLKTTTNIVKNVLKFNDWIMQLPKFNDLIERCVINA